MTKVISISDDVYEDLMKIKGDNESFSKLFRKFAAQEKKKPLLSFFGKWPGKKEELDAIKKELEIDRKAFKTRHISLD
ncbi:antitoxin VapB family protein [Candidatus Woesearchaeota archaeon]|nr:antitoxin VapB family protein [Candidatus Woesearchaeota archaeon]